MDCSGVGVLGVFGGEGELSRRVERLMLDRAFLEDFAYWYKEIVGALGIFGFPVMDVFSSLSLSFHDISCRRLREVDERSTVYAL